ncbi:MAG: hypothetical protein QM808_04080 [Steroidobacteraceae bacterium]
MDYSNFPSHAHRPWGKHAALIAGLAWLALVGVPAQAQAPASSSTPAGGFSMPTQVPETQQEAAAKAVVLSWFRLVFMEGKAAEAFEKYTHREFVEHSRRLRGDYGSTLKALSMMKPRSLNPKALVNDEIVLVQSEIGNEVFRVQNGKITDHWDVNQ